jgi:hypothetical protein
MTDVPISWSEQTDDEGLTECDGITEPLIHLQVTASSVRCGAPMRHWRDCPDGWDMGTVRVDSYGVTCLDCLGVPPNSARRDGQRGER